MAIYFGTISFLSESLPWVSPEPLNYPFPILHFLQILIMADLYPDEEEYPEEEKKRNAIPDRNLDKVSI